MGRIPFLREMPEWFCELKNVIRASIDKAVSRKWVKFYLGVNYPLKAYTNIYMKTATMKAQMSHFQCFKWSS